MQGQGLPQLIPELTSIFPDPDTEGIPDNRGDEYGQATTSSCILYSPVKTGVTIYFTPPTSFVIQNSRWNNIKWINPLIFAIL
jgi:hypothetical protein